MNRPMPEIAAAARRTCPLLLAASLVLSASPPKIYAQSYKIASSIASLPAGSYGTTLSGVLKGDSSPTPDVSLCFYTGYGSASPIVPSTFSGGTFTLSVPSSTIQEVPPSAFTNGIFTALLYTVPLTAATCAGRGQANAGQPTPIALEYPALTSLSLPSASQQNPNLTTRIPATIELIGSNFIAQSSVAFTTSGAASVSIAGNAALINSTSIVSSIPSNIPLAAASVGITACNTAVYSYCTASIPLPLTPLQTESGTVTASLSIANPSQPIGLSATFGPATPSIAGAPSGLVTFTDAATVIVSTPLLLDTTAALVPAPATSFNTTSLPVRPIVVDLNRDGVPDLLFIEPNATTNGAISPVIHVLLGTTPAGQFAADKHYDGLKYLPCDTLLSTAVANFTSDGYPDIAILCSNPTASGPPARVLYTLFNSSSSGLVGELLSYSPLYGDRIAAADFNNDGKPDIVVTGAIDAAGDTGLQVLLGNGDGSFRAGPVSTGLDTGLSSTFGGFEIAAADLNNDGFPDIAILNAATSGNTAATDNYIQLFQNDGTGAFTLATTVPTDGTSTARFFLAPLGPGQIPALIVSSIASSSVSVAGNQATPSIAFSATPKVTPVPGLAEAVVGDVNGDGLLDLAVADASTMHVLTGDGTGLFTATYPSLSVVPPAGAALFAASDENGDGYADLLETVTVGSKTTVYDYITAGTASASVPAMPFAAGGHHIVASFPGTVEIAGASASTEVTSALIDLPIALTASVRSPVNYGSPLTLTGTIADATATGTISFYNGQALLGSVALSANAASAAASLTPPTLAAGTYTLTAVYSGDAAHAGVSSLPLPFVVNAISPALAWTPSPASISYGTALSAAQLDAIPTGLAGAALSGTFTYSPVLGSVLAVGPHPLSVLFTPSNPNYLPASASSSITVTQAVPVITWPTPADVIVDTALSSTQLDATAAAPSATPNSPALPGTFVYTPILGTVLSVAGAETLSVLFTPTDTADYTTATASVSLNVGPLGLNSIVPSAALLGDASKTLTITGTGFSPTTVAQISGPATPAVDIATTYISSTSLTALLPAADFDIVQTLQVLVHDPARDLPSNPLPFTVSAPSTSLSISAPTSISPASQITVVFHLSPYPAPVNATVNLTFKPSGTLPDDPGIVFVASGLRTYPVTVPAHAAELDLPVTFQSGTVAGTLTLTLALEAGGANVTPASIQPIVIDEPAAVGGISSVSMQAANDLLTVTVRGYSNTRKVTGAAFHFTPLSGRTISTPDITIDVTSLFSTWYADPASDQYGSLFTYTEVFNLSSDASVVGQVTVTLTNDVGESQEANTP